MTKSKMVRQDTNVLVLINGKLHRLTEVKKYKNSFWGWRIQRVEVFAYPMENVEMPSNRILDTKSLDNKIKNFNEGKSHDQHTRPKDTTDGPWFIR